MFFARIETHASYHRRPPSDFQMGWTAALYHRSAAANQMASRCSFSTRHRPDNFSSIGPYRGPYSGLTFCSIEHMRNTNLAVILTTVTTMALSDKLIITMMQGPASRWDRRAKLTGDVFCWFSIACMPTQYILKHMVRLDSSLMLYTLSTTI